uniref:Uncharacterized protein n=1 Tax=Pararge aegeria TaxID=116150 RepID=S4NZI1_9NEOP
MTLTKFENVRVISEPSSFRCGLGPMTCFNICYAHITRRTTSTSSSQQKHVHRRTQVYRRGSYALRFCVVQRLSILLGLHLASPLKKHKLRYNMTI